MSGVHRNLDSRACGATTSVTGQSTVYVNDKKVSVDGDPNSHGGGSLNASCNKVFAENIEVVVEGNGASPDDKCPIPGGSHCSPSATGASTDTGIG